MRRAASAVAVGPSPMQRGAAEPRELGGRGANEGADEGMVDDYGGSSSSSAAVVQVIMGLFRAGFIAAFFPSSVIKGLLAAIGVILILKQIPHVLGHDPDPEGDMSFEQPDHENTFTELSLESSLDLSFCHREAMT